MTRRELAFYSGILVVLGMGWGVTQPLTKIAVSTGYQPLGLIFWQLVIGAAAMAAVSLATGRGFPMTWPAFAACAVIALVGTLIPNSAGYKAIAHLPAGVMSILISLVPMMAFPIALVLGLERFSTRRLVGLMAGLAGVLILVLPEASLPERAMLAWIPLALVGPACYAFEGNYVARWGTGGLDAIQVLFGASVLGAAIALPVTLGAGQFISPVRVWQAPEWAFVASSVIHAAVYCGYVWLVAKAGPVFAAQVSYVVTVSGVFWSLVLLGERYSPYIWAALCLVLLGVFLVQPRSQDGLAEGETIKDTVR
ncbi:DMT family transporter [Lutimaribacter marinistellae]|uniref:DMT family transporter n=1 Tax=Lutimaribacter marinistellae TaxID=1820329 RepID=A0ABV7TKJ9_9RHOB